MSNGSLHNKKGMFDVSNKPDTLRTAKARASLKMNASTILTVKKGNNPKGNLLEAAKIASIIGAKKTHELIPFCHLIPIDQVLADVIINSDNIELIVEVKSVWKTGVEMEALMGASVGILTIYDMLKPIDSSLFISSIELLDKSGGLKSFHKHNDQKLTAVVIVISDSVSAGKSVDRSGKQILEKLNQKGVVVIETKVLPDDMNIIENYLKECCDLKKVNLVITTGGTGLGPHDFTPDATKKVIEKEIPGLSETSRAYGQRRTPTSMLSRGISGIRGKTIIINFPGSLNAVSESMESIFPGIFHAFKMIEGMGH